MIAPRWRKVLRDIWGNLSRTTLIIASIAVGVFAFGGLITARDVLRRDLASGYIQGNPASGILVIPAFDDELVDAVTGLREVGEAQGRTEFSVRVLRGEDRFINTVVMVLPDRTGLTISRPLALKAGQEPGRQQVVFERTSAALYGFQVGDTVTFELEDGERKTLTVSGLYQDMNVLPSNLSFTAYAYITESTLDWLGYPDDYNQLYFTAAFNADDTAHIEQVAEIVKDRVELDGYSVLTTDVPDEAQQHPAATVLDAILLLLTSIGAFSLLLSGALILNTITATLNGQIRQIGIMKSIGRRSHQIAGTYFTMSAVYGIMALIVAVPLGAAFARGLATVLSGLLNFDLVSFRVPPYVLIIQAAIAIGVPVISSAIPVVTGTRTSTRSAIYGEAYSKGIGDTWLDKLIAAARGLPRPVMLSLRNTFRQRTRLALTLVTLSLAGAMFIAVWGVRVQFNNNFQKTIDAYNIDAQVILDGSYRASYLEREARRIPGVIDAETWLTGTATRVYPDDTEGLEMLITALPPDSKMFYRPVDEGRWIQAGDGNALVITSDYFNDERDLSLGSPIRLNINGVESDWVIVGVIDAIGGPGGALAYAPFEAFSQEVGQLGYGNALGIRTADRSPAAQQRTVEQINLQFQNRDITISEVESMTDLEESLRGPGNILSNMMLVMVALMAIVGALGLAGAMSLNVMERTREIGAMRSIGATNGAILNVVLVEGLIVGLISALIGIVLALPMGIGLGIALGLAFGGEPIAFAMSGQAVIMWVTLAMIIATVASIIPARQASRISIREALAYE